jgi:hypothetical protein
MVTVKASSVTEPSFAAAAAASMARPPSVGRKWLREEEGRLVAATAARVGTATSGNAGTAASAAGERLLLVDGGDIYEPLAAIERREEKVGVGSFVGCERVVVANQCVEKGAWSVRVVWSVSPG